MATAPERTETTRRTREPLVDADVHVAPASADALDPYLTERWRRHRRTVGHVYHAGADYPRFHPNAARTDAWPPSGLPPGSDLPFLCEQLLDEWNVELAVMSPLTWAGSELNSRFAAALARAVNDWQLAEWVAPEPRLRASVVVPWEDPDASVAEIERLGAHPAFVQVLILSRTLEPLGRPRYRKILASAAEHGLPVALHLGYYGGWPVSGCGFPSFYVEERTGHTMNFQEQLTSLAYEGAFEELPRLRVVLLEGGFAWLLPLMWRLDRGFRLHREELSHLRRPPSETIRRQVYVATQPMEEPPRGEQLLELLERLDMDDRLLFATDYPHWDFDAPDLAFPAPLPPALRRAVMRENGRRLYR